MRKRIRTVLAAAAVLALILTVCPGAIAADAPADEIHIRTAADLEALAKNCSLDTWSDGKRVILDNDISMAGSDFSPIPVFNGVFDGCGHMIADLTLTAPMSPCGLFLETGKDAEIRLLTVSGTVEPAGDNDRVGGIVGLNRGTVSGCLFNGSVSGRSCVGAVAGQNESTGLISSCRAAGTVFGLGQAGGIVGQNNGSVADCENRSFVNTKSVDPSLRLDELDTSSLLNAFGSVTRENADITSNIGGIAGGNDGFIELCTNSGAVGYLHLGCNVGGIAGRSGGHISRCTNAGDIYGRRNAGGVVGRAEPLIQVSKAQDLLSGLGYRMYALNKSIDTAVKDAGNESEALAEELSGLRVFLDPMRQALLGIDPADPSSLLQLRSSLESALSGFSGELKAIGSGLGSESSQLKDDMKDIEENLDKLSGAAMQALTVLSGGEKMDDVVADDSGDPAEKTVLGKVADSTNEGAVHADSNAGGVAGVITVEDDPDWSALAGGDSGSLVQNRYSLRCVLSGCINRGDITAKRECAGGICGKMDFGLTIRCQSYGPVSLEDGSYAGGVCGLSYGTVKDCCSKCSLSGTRYVGGILGNGYDARNADEQSSQTSGCRALVNITGKPQFAAAISGGGAGEYKDDLFVSGEYAGLDRLSIGGVAEPVDFDTFAAAGNVPEECLRFTLTFVSDGKTIKTVPFSYGDSFDRSVFPQVEDRDGLYPVWDRTDLTDLRFDTVVTAEYRTDKTVLRAELTREDGRPAVYADGQFQEGDAMTVELLPVNAEDAQAFRTPWHETLLSQLRTLFSGKAPDYAVCTSVAEELVLSVPEDGQARHAIRYLPPDGSTNHFRVFLMTDDGWERLDADTFGSYLTFTVPGASARIALVRTIQSWWIAAAGAAALLVVVLIIVLTARWIRRLRGRTKMQKKPLRERIKDPAFRKKAAVVIVILCLMALLAAAGFQLLSGRLGAGMAAARMLKDFSKEESAVRAEISIDMDGKETPISTVVRRVEHNGRMVTCADRFGIPLYFSEGQVYLENGRSFRVASHLDQGTMMELAGKIFADGDIEKETSPDGTVFRASIRDETANRLLAMFLGSEYQGMIRTEALTAELAASDGKLRRLSFVGQGTTENGSPVELTAAFVPEPMDQRPVIPQAVLQAMAEGGDATEILTEDMLSLFSGWMKFDEAESLNAVISLRAEGGPLSVSTDCDYFRQRVDGSDVHCVRTPLLTAYFTDRAACTADGSPLPGTENRPRDAARLIGAARELSLEGRFSCEHTDGGRVFTVILDPQASEKTAETVLPQLREMHVSYEDSAISICVHDGSIQSIDFHCRGSVKIVARQIETDLQVSVRFAGEDAHEIPRPVVAALVGGA